MCARIINKNSNSKAENPPHSPFIKAVQHSCDKTIKVFVAFHITIASCTLDLYVCLSNSMIVVPSLNNIH